LKTVADIQVIRHLHLREGWSERRIAKELHIGRRTVHKYLSRDESTEHPAYSRHKPPAAPTMGAFQEIVDHWLDGDREAPRKQRHTAARIHARLADEYDAHLSESTVRHFVARRRAALGLAAHKEAYLHLAFDPGELAQVDWGNALVVVNGEPLDAWMFCMRLAFSTVSFVALYPNGRLEAFMDGHVRAFAFFGGVPLKIVYDNLRSAVTRIVKGRRRELNPRFEGLAAHYVFKPTFANPAAGWEKGLVENLVGFSRRSFLVPVPKVVALENLNQTLCTRLLDDRARVAPERDRRTIGELWDEERRHLLALPPAPFRASTTYGVRVSKLLTVRHQNVQYSVPVQYLGHKLRLEAFFDHVEVYDGDRLVARHALRKAGQPPALELDHYLDVLLRKPGGVRHARVVKELGEEVTAYRDAFLTQSPDAYRSFVEILLLSRRYPREAVLSGIAKARAERIYDPDRVEALIGGALESTPLAAVAPPAGPRVNQPSPARYDSLVAPAGVMA
jgi:transposase